MALLLLSLIGCGDGSTQDPSELPYVVTAIDYHFHDAHPSLPISLDRTLIFRNGGRNIHNVTIIGTDFNRDLPVEGELVIEPVSSLLSDPGLYDFVCTYHQDREMSGVLVLED